MPGDQVIAVYPNRMNSSVMHISKSTYCSHSDLPIDEKISILYSIIPTSTSIIVQTISARLYSLNEFLKGMSNLGSCTTTNVQFAEPPISVLSI